MDMTSGPVLKKMLAFTLPLMFSSILQLLFNAADIVVVGRFAGDDSLAAVGSTTALVNLMTNLFMGLSVGTNVVCARYIGAGKDKSLSRAVHTSVMIGFISGLVLTVVGFFGAKGLLQLMQTPEEVLPLATIYLKIYFFGMPAMMVYNFAAAILRAVGDTKRPLYYLFASGILNVLLNLAFVIIFHMGVAGVALATIISQFMSAFLVIRCLMKETGAIKLILRQLGIDKGIFFKIIQIGLPAGFQGIVFSLSNVVIQASVNGFGNVVVAGNSAAGNIEGFVWVAMNSFHQSTISFVSQNYGGEKYERINKIVITGLLCVFVTGAVLGNLCYIFGQPLLSIYSGSSKVIQAGMSRLSIISATYAICGIMDVMVGALRGIGSSVVPMIVSVVGVCGLRLVWIGTIFQVEDFHRIETVYWSYPVSWILTFVAHSLCFIYLKHKMTKRLSEKNM
ncbi:MAG: MATE family efflux transporter [Ruminococcus sp.]|nr:MATE family efflux transporter [Ruminococcus sp.]